jgi:ketosteroid isomerase-like protein
MDREGFEDWLRRYFDAWVSNDPVDVSALFTEDAIYWVGPFREPWVGQDQIVDRWTSGRQEDVRAPFDVIAADGRCREHREWFSQRELS